MAEDYKDLSRALSITSRISDAETLSQTWLSVAGVAWLSFQAKLNGNFLLYAVYKHFSNNLLDQLILFLSTQNLAYLSTMIHTSHRNLNLQTHLLLTILCKN